MNFLALITSRKGSKRIPGKNTKLLGGKPLVVWSIESLKKVSSDIDIMVSTDDEKVISIAKKYDLIVPWRRPENLSNDFASSSDVAIHALEWYEKNIKKVDGLILIQPTSPFRSFKTINRGINLYLDSNMKSIVSVSPSANHPFWSYKIENNYLYPFIDNKRKFRSQDLPPSYTLNGLLYIISPEELKKEKNFVNKKTIPLIIDSKIESIDIDDEVDFNIAEKYLSEHDK